MSSYIIRSPQGPIRNDSGNFDFGNFCPPPPVNGGSDNREGNQRIWVDCKMSSKHDAKTRTGAAGGAARAATAGGASDPPGGGGGGGGGGGYAPQVVRR